MQTLGLTLWYESFDHKFCKDSKPFYESSIIGEKGREGAGINAPVLSAGVFLRDLFEIITDPHIGEKGKMGTLWASARNESARNN